MKVKKEVSAGGIVFKVVQPRPSRGAGFRNLPKSKVFWLITQHSKFGHWSFPKGLVGDIHKNEEVEEAALREVKEEGGVKAEIVNDKPITTKYTYRWKNTLIKKSVHYFLMRYISGDHKDHDWEVADAKFLPANEAMDLLTFKNDKAAFQQAQALLKL